MRHGIGEAAGGVEAGHFVLGPDPGDPSSVGAFSELNLVQPLESTDKVAIDTILQHPLVRHIACARSHESHQYLLAVSAAAT
jgi:hypothetical protein